MSSPATPTSSWILVHVVGPVEIEAVAGRRYLRQRCLRCDALLSDQRIRAPFVLGELVVGLETPKGWEWLAIHRPLDATAERPCEALQS